MSAKLHDMGMQEGERRIAFHCPGCEYGHQIPVTGMRAWTWNGSLDKPTLQPSILVNRGSANPGVHVCHSIVTDGRIQFLLTCLIGIEAREGSSPGGVAIAGDGDCER
jgi:Family of unknown function (DUF6527)